MKTEREFNIALKRTLRHTRNHNKYKNPIQIAQEMGVHGMNVYLAYENGYIPITAYQLYQFIQITNMPPDVILELFTR